jgi:hypothetical protein
MPKEQPIIYEPHPVTAARKAELRGQGFKILDAVFAPPGTKVALLATALTPPAGARDDIAAVLALANGQFMTFKSAAKKLLGDALPAKKPEIVAALEALASGAEPVSEAPDGTPIPIPEEWEAMTDEELIALAGELIAGEVVVSGNGETQAEKAHSIIMATVTDRANPPAKPE